MRPPRISCLRTPVLISGTTSQTLLSSRFNWPVLEVIDVSIFFPLSPPPRALHACPHPEKVAERRKTLKSGPPLPFFLLYYTS